MEADDKLLDKLVTSVDPTGQLAPGPDLVTRFDKINSELRAKNNQQMSDLRFKTEEKILWNGPFIHWGKEEADFADVRNWMHDGKKIDQAVHLGFDLSDVQNGPVTPPTTAAWCGPPISGSTATASCSITATRCNRSTATCARST